MDLANATNIICEKFMKNMKKTILLSEKEEILLKKIKNLKVQDFLFSSDISKYLKNHNLDTLGKVSEYNNAEFTDGIPVILKMFNSPTFLSENDWRNFFIVNKKILENSSIETMQDFASLDFMSIETEEKLKREKQQRQKKTKNSKS